MTQTIEELEKLKKEVEDLKRKIFYMTVLWITFAISIICTLFTQARQYAVIHDYYCESVAADQEMQTHLKEVTRELEQILSIVQ